MKKYALKALHKQSGRIIRVIKIGNQNFDGIVLSDPTNTFKPYEHVWRMVKNEHHLIIDWDYLKGVKNQISIINTGLNHIGNSIF